MKTRICLAIACVCCAILAFTVAWWSELVALGINVVTTTLLAVFVLMGENNEDCQFTTRLERWIKQQRKARDGMRKPEG